MGVWTLGLPNFIVMDFWGHCLSLGINNCIRYYVFWVTCFTDVVRLCHNQLRNCADTGVITNLNLWPSAVQLTSECFTGILHPSSPDLHYSCHLLACNLSQSPFAHQLPVHRADVIVILNNIKFDMQCMVMQIGHKSDSFQNSSDGKGSGKNLALLAGVHNCSRVWHIALGMFMPLFWN